MAGVDIIPEKNSNCKSLILDAKVAHSDVGFVVIAASINCDDHTCHFDTSVVEVQSSKLCNIIRTLSWSSSLRLLWAIVLSSMRNLTARMLFLARNSCASQRFCTTMFTLNF